MAGDERVGRKSTVVAKSERTERILIGRLEELARALERSGAPNESISRLLESASVATMNAIALQLISEEAADSIWRGVEERHPRVAPLRRAA
jgi:hypothetical protein